jgi:hypothetical protein
MPSHCAAHETLRTKSYFSGSIEIAADDQDSPAIDAGPGLGVGW